MPKPRQFPWSQSELQALIHYDPATGEVTREGKRVGTARKDGRIQLCLNGSAWLRARIAWFYMTGEQIPHGLSVDHVNRDPADDRWDNLRLANPTEQVVNRACVEFKAGYQWSSAQQRWRVRSVTRNDQGRRKTHCFGEYTCEERAKRVAKIVKEEMAARTTAYP